MHFWGVVTVVGYLLTLLLIPVVLLTKKRYPVSTVAWMMVIVVLPYAGGLLFVVFGINRVDRRAPQKQQSTLSIARRLPECTQYQLIPGEGLDAQQQWLMRLAKRIAGTMPTFANHIELLSDTNRTLAGLDRAGHPECRTDAASGILNLATRPHGHSPARPVDPQGERGRHRAVFVRRDRFDVLE